MSVPSIKKHEFYDCEVQLECVDKHLICFWVKTKYPEFNKQDVIAMAKHLKLTAEDLGKGEHE